MIRFPDFSFPGAPDPGVQKQPAGFDLSLRSVQRFSGSGMLDFSNAQRALPELEELPWPADGPLTLEPGGYLVTYNEEIAVPADCAGVVLPRSSLMRCGATLHSALWDPGYRGRGQGLLSVFNRLSLQRDARIAQFVLFATETEADSLYSGNYQGENLDELPQQGYVG